MKILIAKALFNYDWITIVFLVVFLLLVIAKLKYNERLFELATLFFSKKYIIKYIEYRFFYHKSPL